jgi:hypothetical protein
MPRMRRRIGVLNTAATYRERRAGDVYRCRNALQCDRRRGPQFETRVSCDIDIGGRDAYPSPRYPLRETPRRRIPLQQDAARGAGRASAPQPGRGPGRTAPATTGTRCAAGPRSPRPRVLRLTRSAPIAGPRPRRCALHRLAHATDAPGHRPHDAGCEVGHLIDQSARRFKRAGASPVDNKPGATGHFRDFIANDIAKWQKVVQGAGIVAEAIR